VLFLDFETGGKVVMKNCKNNKICKFKKKLILVFNLNEI